MGEGAIKNLEYAYVATLGLYPAVVTLGLNKILDRYPHHKIRKICIIHTSPQGEVKNSLERLKRYLEDRNDFQVSYYQIGDAVDIDVPRGLEITFKTIFTVVREMKEKGFAIHLNIAGGRKIMSLFGIVTAQLLFDSNDFAWYLLSDKTVQESGIMEVGYRDPRVKLIPIPIIPWSDVDPILTVISTSDNPLSDDRIMRALVKKRENRIKEIFVREILSKSEKNVLKEIIFSGGSNKEISQKLSKSEYTIRRQVESIYRKFREYFSMNEKHRMNKIILIKELGPVVERLFKNSENV